MRLRRKKGRNTEEDEIEVNNTERLQKEEEGIS